MVNFKFHSILICLIIFFLFFSIHTFAQDSLIIDTQTNISNQIISGTDNFSVDTVDIKEVSVGGAALLSTLLPGCGLYLTEDYLPATLYLTLATGAYFGSIAIIASSSEVDFENTWSIMLTGGFIHFISIVHTIIAAIEYNENITPMISYNGKDYQFGLSIKL
jgi:hypothetical protein